jgi:uncharacterized membrane protein
MFTFLSGLTILLLKLHQGNALSSPYFTRILTGALMGTFMWANVWFVIWPAQKVVIASAQQIAGGGEAIPEAAARGARAGTASRINTVFSIPMLFFMGSASHLPSLLANPSLGAYWLVALVIIVAVEIHALIGPGLPTQKPLTSVTGTIHAGLGLTLLLYVVGVVL